MKYWLLALSLFFLEQANTQCTVIVDAGPDLFVCAPGDITMLNGSVSNADCFEWSPSVGLNDSTLLNPQVTITTPLTYTLSSFATDNSNNLVDNGDFETGNTGFTSSYTYNPTTFSLFALYTIITSPSLISSNLPPCTDHSSGSGNLLLIRGDAVPGGSFWCQNINVSPNTNYQFSYWISTVIPIDPGTVQVSANGTLLNPSFTASATSCEWQMVQMKWFSGTNTTVDFCLTSQSTSFLGNTFAIDDIALYEMCEVTDEVEVGVINLDADLAPISILPCQDGLLNLQAINLSLGANISYNWSTQNGNIVGANNTPSINVDEIGTYTLTVIYADGNSTCSEVANTTVIEDPTIPVAFAQSMDSIDCTNPIVSLSGAGSSQGNNISYNWTTIDGNILNGNSSLFPNVASPGTYTLTVINTDNNCSESADVTVFADFTTPIASALSPVQIDCGMSNLSLNGAGSSNNANYLWTTSSGNIINGSTTLAPEINQSGNYTLIVTSNINGCIDSTSVVVNSAGNLPIANAGSDSALDCNLTQSQLDGSLSSIGSNISYEWTTGNGNFVSSNLLINPDINQSGTYVLEVINTDNNCSAFDTVNVANEAIHPVANAGNPITLTCTLPANTLSGSGTIGANITYEWTTVNGCISANANTLSPSIDVPGDYQLIVTDTSNGCATIDNVSVFQDTIAPIANAGASFEIDCDTTTSNLLDGSNSSVGANFSYEWTTNNGAFASSSNLISAEISIAGTYLLEVTDTLNGCTALDSVAIVQNADVPFINIQPANSLTCDSSIIVLNANASQMGANIALSWASSDGNFLANQNSYSPTVNQAGEYILTLINTNNNCSASASVEVQIDTVAPIAYAGLDQVFDCANTLFDLEGTEISGTLDSLAFQWMSFDGSIIGNGNGANIQANSPGDYTFQVVNLMNGCEDEDQLLINLDTISPNASAGNNIELDCTTTSVNLNGSGSSMGPEYSYTWSTNNGNIIDNINLINPAINSEGWYILEVSDTTNACASIDSVLVTNIAETPIANAGMPDTLNCLDTMLTLEGTGNMGIEYSYNWSTTDGNILMNGNTLNPIIDTPGSYQLLILNTDNDCADSSIVVISQDIELPTAIASGDFELTCTTLETTISGIATSTNASASFEWSSLTGNISSNATTLSPTVNAAGTYLLTVIDNQNNCLAIDSVIISQDANLPISNASTTQSLDCINTILTLNGNGSSTAGNLQYQWTTSNGNILTNPQSLSPTVDSAGVYVLTVTDLDNNCEAISSVEVQDQTIEPIIVLQNPNPIDCQNTNTTIDATGSDFGANFQYTWQNSAGNEIITPNPNVLTVDEAGTFSLTILNTNNGCQYSESLMIVIDTLQPIANLSANAVVDCENPLISISTNGSSQGPEMLYNWATSDGQFESLIDLANPTVDAGGVYSLIITNQNNGCSTSDSILIDEDTQVPIIDINTPEVLSCIHEDVLLTCNSDGNSYLYNWSAQNGGMLSSTNMSSTLASDPDIYACIVTNPENQCTAQAMISVNQNITEPSILLSSDFPAITCETESINLSSTIEGTDGNDLYTWSSTNGSFDGTTVNSNSIANSSGLYQLSVLNTINGCSAIATIDILEDTNLPNVNAGAIALLTCGEATTELDATIGTSQGNQFTYLWSGNGLVSGETSLTPSINQIGFYTLTVLNTDNACIDADQVEVIENEPNTVDFETIDATCEDARGSLIINSVIGGTSPYIYSVNGEDFISQDNFNNLSPGAFQLTVQDANGCELVNAFAINEATQLEVSLPDALQLALGDSVQIMPLLNIDTSQVDSVLWSPSTFLSCDTCLMPYALPFETAAYEVFIQDTNGCRSTAQITIFVDERPDIYIPNAFSPRDNNGENDIFYINARKGSVTQIESFAIYSRWGQEVFFVQNIQPNNPTFGWDGIFEGQLMNSAVFTYHAILELVDGRMVEMKGDLVLK